MIIDPGILDEAINNINLQSIVKHPTAENLAVIIQIHLQERQTKALEDIANKLEIIARNSKIG